MAQKKQKRRVVMETKKEFSQLSLCHLREGKKEKPGKAEEKCEDKRVQREFSTLLLKPLRG